MGQLIRTGRKHEALLFYAALILLLFPSFLIMEDARPDGLARIFKYLKYLGSALCLAKIAITGSEHPRYALTCLSIFLLLFISSRLSLCNDLAYTFLLVAASRDTDYKVTLRVYLCFFALMLLLNPALFMAGLSGNLAKHRLDMTGNSLGFPNPNTLAYVLLMLTMLMACMSEPARSPKRMYALCLTMALVTWVLTLSITCATLLVVFPAVCQFFQKTRKPATWTAAIPVAAVLISVLLATVTEPGYGESTFASRFSIPHLSCKIMGLSWLGHDFGVTLPPSAMHEGFREPLYLDNAFLCVPLRDGIIPAIIYTSFLCCLLYRISKAGKPVLLAAIACTLISGFMENYPASFVLNFTLLSISDTEWTGDRRIWRPVGTACMGLTAAVLLFMFSPWLPCRHSEDVRAPRIGDIAVPCGYERQVSTGDGYQAFIRNLPLAPETERVAYYENPEMADAVEPYCHRVVDMPLLSVSEQCADACIHIRAEYLFQNRRYRDLHFEDTQHNVMRYPWMGGRLREAYNNYLRHVYDWANTESLRNEMARRDSPADVEAGDVWCYDAHSRDSVRYGHAMTVADVAIDSVTGEKIVMLVQGSTPACSIHVLRNTVEPEISPWFRITATDGIVDFGFAKYRPDELYHFRDRQ